jgi:sugar-specific transcriptional regulator TrmB
MYSHILTKLDLSKNEAIIYETLLKYGKASVSQISDDCGIHRRNIYDTLNHLLAKGLVSEIVGYEGNHYLPVHPKKLNEILEEKETELESIMPALEKMYQSDPHTESVCIYKGVEGWKNYLRDVLEAGEDLYTIGGNGAWSDDRLKTFLADFLEKAEKKKIKFHMLYGAEEKDVPKSILETTKGRHKFLPKKYTSNSALEIFGDYVVVFSNIIDQKIDNTATLTVIKNRNVADAFRTWFQMIWDLV